MARKDQMQRYRQPFKSVAELDQMITDSNALIEQGREEVYREMESLYWPQVRRLHELEMSVVMMANNITYVLAWRKGQRFDLLSEQLNQLSIELSKNSAAWRNYATKAGAAQEYIDYYMAMIATIQDSVNLALAGDPDSAAQLLIDHDIQWGATFSAPASFGGRELEAHTLLIATTANDLLNNRYPWRDVTILTYCKIKEMPEDTAGRNEAIGQLEVYGNFWNNREANYSNDALDRARSYIKTTWRRKFGGDQKGL